MKNFKTAGTVLKQFWSAIITALVIEETTNKTLIKHSTSRSVSDDKKYWPTLTKVSKRRERKIIDRSLEKWKRLDENKKEHLKRWKFKVITNFLKA